MGEEEERDETGGEVEKQSWEAMKNGLSRLYLLGMESSLWFTAGGGHQEGVTL